MFVKVLPNKWWCITGSSVTRPLAMAGDISSQSHCRPPNCRFKVIRPAGSDERS
jgi:hypothetical protein